MALPENEEALNKMLEDARAAAIVAEKAAAQKVLEGTSFKTLEDLKIAHVNAEKKISEQGTELGALRKLKEQSTTQQSDDEIIESLNDDERDALASLYEKNKAIAKQIDAGGKKAQAEAIRSLREVKPPSTSVNPFKKATQKEAAQDLKRMIHETIRQAERGSNRSTGASEQDTDGSPRPRAGVSGYFKQ